MAKKKAEKAPGLPRLPKAETVSVIRDLRTGEAALRCRFCGVEHSIKDAWMHRCPGPLVEREAPALTLDGNPPEVADGSEN